MGGRTSKARMLLFQRVSYLVSGARFELATYGL